MGWAGFDSLSSIFTAIINGVLWMPMRSLSFSLQKFGSTCVYTYVCMPQVQTREPQICPPSPFNFTVCLHWNYLKCHCSAAWQSLFNSSHNVPEEQGRQVMLSIWQQWKMGDLSLASTLCCSAVSFFFFSMSFYFSVLYLPAKISLNQSEYFFIFPPFYQTIIGVVNHICFSRISTYTRCVMIWLFLWPWLYVCNMKDLAICGRTLDQPRYKKLTHSYMDDKSSTMILLKDVKASSASVCGTQNHIFP